MEETKISSKGNLKADHELTWFSQKLKMVHKSKVT